jgi:siderophore synthetase component
VAQVSLGAAGNEYAATVLTSEMATIGYFNPQRRVQQYNTSRRQNDSTIFEKSVLQS